MATNRRVYDWASASSVLTPADIARALGQELSTVERWLVSSTIEDCVRVAVAWKIKHGCTQLPMPRFLSLDKLKWKTPTSLIDWVQHCYDFIEPCRELLGLDAGDAIDDEDIRAIAMIVGYATTKEFDNARVLSSSVPTSSLVEDNSIPSCEEFLQEHGTWSDHSSEDEYMKLSSVPIPCPLPTDNPVETDGSGAPGEHSSAPATTMSESEPDTLSPVETDGNVLPASEHVFTEGNDRPIKASGHYGLPEEDGSGIPDNDRPIKANGHYESPEEHLSTGITPSLLEQFQETESITPLRLRAVSLLKEASGDSAEAPETITSDGKPHIELPVRVQQSEESPTM
ncbi:hypothetical protein FPV67DRAFT_1461970, partial [Lyophyllum atratum]